MDNDVIRAVTLRRGLRRPAGSALVRWLLMGAFAAGCGNADPSARPNIVLITVDTLRADRVNPYGYEAIRTPAIQQLADEGVVFEKAFCDTTWTIPSVASTMTGKYPVEHGVRTPFDRLAQGETTLAELLRSHGYRTAAIVGSFPVDHRFGFDQGFDSYDDETSRPYVAAERPEPVKDEWFDGTRHERLQWYEQRMQGDAYRSDAEVADRVLGWLDANHEAPVFLWIHFFGPHQKPARTPQPTDPRERRIAMSEAYDRDVEDMDHHVGRVLARIRAHDSLNEAVIVFHSDHGETLVEHARPGHGNDLYETTAHIPLIVRLPHGERAGERVSHLVRNIDIFPTVLGLAGIPVPPGLPGQDLLTRHDDDRTHAYLEARLLRSLTGIRTPQWKLIVHGAERSFRGNRSPPSRKIELYDLADDPGELRDVASAEPGRVAAMLEVLRAYPQRAASPTPSVGELDREARDKLRALGYLE